MKKTVLAFCIVGFLVVGGQRAYACECVQKSFTAWGELQTSDAVFVGRVVETREVEIPLDSDGTFRKELEVTLVIRKALKGVEGTTLVLRTGVGGGDCGFGFKKGKRYLIYAYRQDGTLRTDGCTRTKPLSYAAQDFKEIEAGVELKDESGGIQTSLH